MSSQTSRIAPRTRSRCSFAMFLLMATAAPSAFAGLVGHWTFDEGAGLVAADSSGNGRTGTLLAASGGSAPTWTNDGISGNALSFDGTGYVDLTNTASAFNFGVSGFTVAAWARYSTLIPADSSIASKHDAGNGNGFLLTARTAGTAWFYSNGNDTTGVLSTMTYDDNQWHFLVGTNDGTTGRLYVDGQYIGSQPGTPIGNGVDMLVGGVFRRGEFVAGFVGSIDDVRVYDNALKQAEISQIYTYYTSTVPEPGTGWLFGSALAGLVGFARRSSVGRVGAA